MSKLGKLLTAGLSVLALTLTLSSATEAAPRPAGSNARPSAPDHVKAQRPKYSHQNYRHRRTLLSKGRGSPNELKNPPYLRPMTQTAAQAAAPGLPIEYLIYGYFLYQMLKSDDPPPIAAPAPPSARPQLSPEEPEPPARQRPVMLSSGALEKLFPKEGVRLAQGSDLQKLFEQQPQAPKSAAESAESLSGGRTNQP